MYEKHTNTLNSTVPTDNSKPVQVQCVSCTQLSKLNHYTAHNIYFYNQAATALQLHYVETGLYQKGFQLPYIKNPRFPCFSSNMGLYTLISLGEDALKEI